MLQLDRSGRYICEQCRQRIARYAIAQQTIIYAVRYPPDFRDDIEYEIGDIGKAVPESHLCCTCYFDCDDACDEDEEAVTCPTYSMNIFDEDGANAPTE